MFHVEQKIFFISRFGVDNRVVRVPQAWRCASRIVARAKEQCYQAELGLREKDAHRRLKIVTTISTNSSTFVTPSIMQITSLPVAIWLSALSSWSVCVCNSFIVVVLLEDSGDLVQFCP
jgi:hypothetical protein